MVGFLSDLFLACAVLDGDAPALRTFDDQLLTPARSSIARVHPAPEFVDDASQELRTKLLLGPEPRLTRYQGRTPLGAWVRVVAVRLARDVARTHAFRPLDSQGDGDLALAAGASIEPELQLLKNRLSDTFQSALRAGLTSLSVRERTVLRMHLIQRLSIDQIAVPYGVHRATAARWLTDVRDKLQAQVRARVSSAHPNLSPSEIDSLGRLVESQMHVTLSRL